MGTFMDNLQDTLGEEMNASVTENGAIGYRTSGHELLDLNFKISSLREKDEAYIENYFWKAYYENPILAIKWLFFASDVREGVGERRLFKICFRVLCESKPKVAMAVLFLIPEYSRFDNMFVALGTSLEDQVVEFVKQQLNEDMENAKAEKSISLLAKWMPSANASSKEHIAQAIVFTKKLGLSPRQYRKMLSSLRKYLNIVERKMCSKEWGAIDYAAVPSKANIMYNSAFLRNDEERRREYLDALQKGETKINSSVLFPHDIVHKYFEKGHYGYSGTSFNGVTLDIALEEMWKGLKNFVGENDSTICVMDGSGSMTNVIDRKTGLSPIQIAMALAIYFAEKCFGQYRDKFITFSETPRFIDLSNGKSLLDKIRIASNYNEIANTNIEAVFDLILMTAIKHKMTQDQMPKNILILSDMEFDSCAVTSSYTTNYNRLYGSRTVYAPADVKLFGVIKERYEAAGYKLPRMIFWNICSRTGTIPVKENEMGVTLVSGFSPAVMKMVLSNKTDPYECLIEQLNDERYLPVEKALDSVTM